MDDLGVQPWRAGENRGFGAKAQMFAQDNTLQTFAIQQRDFAESGRIGAIQRREKRVKRTDCYKIPRNTVRSDKNNGDWLTNSWAWAIMQT